MKRLLHGVLPLLLAYFLFSCNSKPDVNQGMITLLKEAATRAHSPRNNFAPEAKMEFYDSLRKTNLAPDELLGAEFFAINALLELGEEEEAILKSEQLLAQIPYYNRMEIWKAKRTLAIAYLRYGERMNCLTDHSGEACVFPIRGKGVHINKDGSQKAIEIYTSLLQEDPSDLESLWLLNIAYMTINGYPGNVPPRFLLKGLDSDSFYSIKPFIDVASSNGVNTKNMAGGSIVDDFNNDGYLDIITSSWGLREGMHYCRSNSNGTFTDISLKSGLRALTGGLNITQTDYNNDGFKDIFVLRGAWKGVYGNEPNSLLRNNGDGTFTDVTIESGLLSFHPTQTATWADFNNDGWLDVFIGNESSGSHDSSFSELYINNKNGTFREAAEQSGCRIKAYVKGVTSGDYDNDGFPDLFLSTLDGNKILLKNKGVVNGNLSFENVTHQAGLGKNLTRSFTTWFWDFDNDGWLDILVCGYHFTRSLAWYAAAEAMNMPVENTGQVFLFRNKHDGSFEDISNESGLNKIVFAMGANFGDIDNDGYPDACFGTGNPLYQSLVPNKMFKNIDGRRFVDITSAARVGNLQKGHGVSFADMDNDGDQDIHIDMGGAFTGDSYQNSLYINPGQNNNKWVSISLEGTTTNKAAIGAKIKVTFVENGIERSVYRNVNSGGSFGSNPLTQHIGIGQAVSVKSVEVTWPVNGKKQSFFNIQPGERIKITEGSNSVTRNTLKKSDLTSRREGLITCFPE